MKCFSFPRWEMHSFIHSFTYDFSWCACVCSSAVVCMFSLEHLSGFSEKVNGIVTYFKIYVYTKLYIIYYPCYVGMAKDLLSFPQLKAYFPLRWSWVFFPNFKVELIICPGIFHLASSSQSMDVFSLKICWQFLSEIILFPVTCLTSNSVACFLQPN